MDGLIRAASLDRIAMALSLAVVAGAMVAPVIDRGSALSFWGNRAVHPVLRRTTRAWQT